MSDFQLLLVCCEHFPPNLLGFFLQAAYIRLNLTNTRLRVQLLMGQLMRIRDVIGFLLQIDTWQMAKVLNSQKRKNLSVLLKSWHSPSQFKRMSSLQRQSDPAVLVSSGRIKATLSPPLRCSHLNQSNKLPSCSGHLHLRGPEKSGLVTAQTRTGLSRLYQVRHPQLIYWLRIIHVPVCDVGKVST